MALFQNLLGRVRGMFQGSPETPSAGAAVSNPAKAVPDQYRHGDVIIARVDSVPPGANSRPSAILARGEATGHSHRITEPSAVQVFDWDGVGYLSVTADSATLVHDEHRPIQLPRGHYRFWQQREYTPQEIRTIVD